jgi:hypothetical protein
VGLRAPFSRRPTDTGAALVLATMAIILVAALPVAAAGLALTLGIVTVAPGLFLATPSLLEIIGRTVTALWPLIAVLAVFLLLAQTFGAVAIHAPVGGTRVAPRLGHAARDVLRNPARRLATAAASMLADLATLIVSVALLRVLWAPIGADLGGGRLLTPATLALLLGFVTIWLGLVLGAGAIRTWLAAWWSLEIGSDNRGDAVDAS